jgi:hypothetical protein
MPSRLRFPRCPDARGRTAERYFRVLGSTPRPRESSTLPVAGTVWLLRDASVSTAGLNKAISPGTDRTQEAADLQGRWPMKRHRVQEGGRRSNPQALIEDLVQLLLDHGERSSRQEILRIFGK